MHVVSFINVINNILIENNPKNYVDFQGVQSLGSSYFGNLTQRKGQTLSMLMVPLTPCRNLGLK